MSMERGQERINPEVLIHEAGTGIANFVRHRTERLGDTVLRDAVTFSLPDRPLVYYLFSGGVPKIYGSFSFKEDLSPNPDDVESLENYRKWLLKTWTMADPRVPKMIAEIDAQIAGDIPSARQATLIGQLATGEYVEISQSEKEGEQSRLTALYSKQSKVDVEQHSYWGGVYEESKVVPVDPTLAVLVLNTNNQWGVEKTEEPATENKLSALERVSEIATVTDKWLDRTITKAEVARLESKVRIARQMGQSADFLARTKYTGGEQQGLIWQPSVTARIPLEETERRIRQGDREVSRISEYYNLIQQTKAGTRSRA